jgi:hypothetical protein
MSLASPGKAVGDFRFIWKPRGLLLAAGRDEVPTCGQFAKRTGFSIFQMRVQSRYIMPRSWNAHWVQIALFRLRKEAQFVTARGIIPVNE